MAINILHICVGKQLMNRKFRVKRDEKELMLNFMFLVFLEFHIDVMQDNKKKNM